MTTVLPITHRVRHRARKLRLARSLQLNRQVTIREVAQAIGVDESRLSRFEAQTSASVDIGLLSALASYYHLIRPSCLRLW